MTVVTRGSARVDAGPQPVEGLPGRLALRVTLHELGKGGLGICCAVTQCQQSSPYYRRVPAIRLALHHLPKPVLGLVPMRLSSVDQEAAQLDARMLVIGKQSHHLAQRPFARVP